MEIVFLITHILLAPTQPPSFPTSPVTNRANDSLSQKIINKHPQPFAIPSDNKKHKFYQVFRTLICFEIVKGFRAKKKRQNNGNKRKQRQVSNWDDFLPIFCTLNMITSNKCMMADFQIALISGIVGVFCSGFLHRTTVNDLENGF